VHQARVPADFVLHFVLPLVEKWADSAKGVDEVKGKVAELDAPLPAAAWFRAQTPPSRLARRCQVWHKGGVKSLTEQLWFEVPNRRGFVNITETIETLVRKSEIQEGLCLVNAMHITASVFINDAEDGLLHDYEVWLEKLAPHAPTSQYQHNRTGEDNADAHMKRQIMGREVVVAITKGKLDFGPWEQIFYGEFDGRRRKRVLVKIIGE
jgi:secondary thiamine-phosphate synthase enzyme